MSPISQKPTSEITGQFGVSTVFETSFFARFSQVILHLREKQRKHAIGKPLQDRERKEREGFVISVAESLSKKSGV